MGGEGKRILGDPVRVEGSSATDSPHHILIALFSRRCRRFTKTPQQKEVMSFVPIHTE